ncbi:MAG: FkbM family methyltransferase, partial [Gammaproteobacteria bacterium]|nr:FkbM family methyltransferase [Gammaproteobacteria bacterium]
GGSSRFVEVDRPTSGKIENVPIVSVDEAVPADRQVSIIQLDVEGFEQLALAGALKTIARCRPAIMVEVRAESDLLSSDWLARNILKLGYRMTGT